jgi:hypothetical protein
MMAHRCDRCNNYWHRGNPINFILGGLRNNADIIRMDLCEGCAKEMYEHLILIMDNEATDRIAIPECQKAAARQRLS